MDTSQITEPLPSCAEDVILVRAHNAWACGPAADDVALTTDTEDCNYMIGYGTFVHGTWDAYQCAVQVRVPDTSTLAQRPSEGVMPIILAVALLLSLMLAAWREKPR